MMPEMGTEGMKEILVTVEKVRIHLSLVVVLTIAASAYAQNGLTAFQDCLMNSIQ